MFRGNCSRYGLFTSLAKSRESVTCHCHTSPLTIIQQVILPRHRKWYLDGHAIYSTSKPTAFVQSRDAPNLPFAAVSPSKLSPTREHRSSFAAAVSSCTPSNASKHFSNSECGWGFVPRPPYRRASRLPQVPLSIRPGTFKLPQSPHHPLILVGPGTGVAPMRSVVLERRRQRGGLRWPRGDGAGAASGGMGVRVPDTLFFGCRWDVRRGEEGAGECSDGDARVMREV